MPRAFVAIAAADNAARQDFRMQLRALGDGPDGGFAIDEIGPLLIASRGLARMHPETDRGMVLGRVAAAIGSSGRPLAAAEIDEPEEAAQHLVRDCWGSYVAAFVSPSGQLTIWRAPLGDLPCYTQRQGSDLLLASSPRLLAAFAAKPLQICREAIARQLAFAYLQAQDTCLEGVEELAGGQCLVWSAAGIERRTIWSPWIAATRKPPITDPADAASRLRNVARQCVAGSARALDSVLLKLSGGLDSSIVAACLADSGIPFRALTLVTDDPAGDERRYARMVARHIGVELIEARRDPARIDPSLSPARDLPRPSIPLFRQESDRIAAEEAERSGSALVMDGGGGDNVFCALQSASPVADCLLRRAGWRHCAPTAASLAEMAQVSVPAVLHAAISRAVRPSRGYRWPLQSDFLSQDARAFLARAPHPWLQAPPGALPGRAAHVALIAAAQSYVEGLDPIRDPPLAVPLLAQPLVELCLRIPSWLWFDGGLNRAVARRAFAGELPPAILRRRSKGTPDSFLAQIFELHRQRIRDELLGGALRSQGLIDLPALLALFASGRPLADGELQRIMALYDAEIWCRAWSS